MNKEIRCGQCNKLLAKGQAIDLTIKCPRCGAFNTVSAMSTSPEGRESRRENENDQEREPSTSAARRAG